MRNMNKKRGFTIIELVVVVAVIAILAGVLIPTFTGIINKSKESSDESAIRNMNTVLAADGAVEPTSAVELFDVLLASGIDAKNFKPLYSDRYFFWDSGINKVLYTDKNYNVLYPTRGTEDANPANWISLSGEIEAADLDDVTLSADKKTATVKNAAELVALMDAINDKKNDYKDITKISLAAGEYNLMGADIGLVERDLKTNLEIVGAVNADGTPATILNGMVANKFAREVADRNKREDRDYGSGLLGFVYSTVTISNIEIRNATVGSSTTSSVGLLVASVVSDKANVTIDNVKITDSTVRGMQKVGGIIGHVQGGTLTVNDNCEISGLTVQATVGLAGGVFGYLNKGTATATVSDFATDKVKVELVEIEEGDYRTYTGTEFGTEGLIGNKIGLDLTIDLEPSTEKGFYRYFPACAQYGFYALQETVDGKPTTIYWEIGSYNNETAKTGYAVAAPAGTGTWSK